MLVKLAGKCFAFLYAFFNLFAIVAVAGVRNGAFFHRFSDKEKAELASAQKQLWSLKSSPIPGFTHQFLKLRNGMKLHYVVKEGEKGTPSGPRNVALFIHGFPDSFLLWKNLLKASTLESYVLIAVDLPGYGGSDNPKEFSANDILEAMAEFILNMREKYLQTEAKMVVVSHDWGAIVSARLASEAAQLADHWIIAGALIPKLVYSNAISKAESAKQMLHTYLRHPLRFSLLRNAFNTLEPVISQMRRSFYIFIFNLPYPFAVLFATFGDYWFLRTLHSLATGHRPPRKLAPKETGEFLAMAIGPSPSIVDETEDAYSITLKNRSADFGMSNKIRIYREGLFAGIWEKSIETVVGLAEIPSHKRKSNAKLFDSGPRGALKAPATIVYGERDVAFERRLALEGIDDYLVEGSQVVLAKGCGHWIPMEKLGGILLERIVVWAIGDNEASLKKSFDEAEEVEFLLEK